VYKAQKITYSLFPWARLTSFLTLAIEVSILAKKSLTELSSSMDDDIEEGLDTYKKHNIFTYECFLIGHNHYWWFMCVYIYIFIWIILTFGGILYSSETTDSSLQTEAGLSALTGISKCSRRNKLSEAHNLLILLICSVCKNKNKISIIYWDNRCLK